jgi:hypothetical protein
MGATALKAGLAAVVIMTPWPAYAQESWVCAWPGYLDGKPVIDRFTIDGDSLVDSTFGTRYKILQNNEFSIISAWSFSEIESNNTEPSIGAYIVMIDKKKGTIRNSNAILDEKDPNSAGVS